MDAKGFTPVGKESVRELIQRYLWLDTPDRLLPEIQDWPLLESDFPRLSPKQTLSGVPINTAWDMYRLRRHIDQIYQDDGPSEGCSLLFSLLEGHGLVNAVWHSIF